MKPSWKQVSLSKLQKLGQADLQTGPFGTVLKASEYTTTGVPVVSVGEIREGYLRITKHTPRVDEQITSRLSKYVLEAGDIVFGRKGAINRNSIINEKQDGWFLGSDGIRLRLSKEIDSKFVSYQLRSNAIGKWLLQSSTGSIMPSLNQKILDRLPLWLPDLTTQNRISSILSTLDEKIALNKRINTELEGMAKLLYDYWFVQFDFPDENGQPYKSSGGEMVYNERLKREIPVGWEVKRLDEVLTVVRGASPRPINDYISEEGLPWIKISDATKSENRFIIKTKQFIKQEGESKTRVLEPNSLILSNSASPAIPRIVKIRSGIHDGWLLIKNLKYSLSREFLYHYFIYERPRIINLGSGSIFKNLKTDYVKELNIILPPEELLKHANKEFRTISERIYFSTIESQELSDLRDWLLPMLMNGQVRVGE